MKVFPQTILSNYFMPEVVLLLALDCTSVKDLCTAISYAVIIMGRYVRIFMSLVHIDY